MAIDEKKLVKDLLTWYSGKRLYCINHGFYDLLYDFEEFFDAFEDIIKAQPKLSLETKTSDKWIPCSKELPPKPKCCLWKAYIVQQENVFYPYVAYFTDDGWRDDDLDEIRNVIAWMTLPEPYKGDE